MGTIPRKEDSCYWRIYQPKKKVSYFWIVAERGLFEANHKISLEQLQWSLKSLWKEAQGQIHECDHSQPLAQKKKEVRSIIRWRFIKRYKKAYNIHRSFQKPFINTESIIHIETILLRMVDTRQYQRES